jgi:hypothetical protein
VEHQHLVCMPPFDHLCHHLHFFWLDISSCHILHRLSQWFITYIIKILICSLEVSSFIEFHIVYLFYQVCGVVEYSICLELQ